ncbi:MAG: hypothetical protein H6Q40_180, partial [Deltaproteobacteria bacterium]|nr:hypothetical protein [Deltaproteobacteria bacterium]
MLWHTRKLAEVPGTAGIAVDSVWGSKGSPDR